MPDFELFIGPQKIETFRNGWVKRELDTVADSFELQIADLRLKPGEPVPVRAGDSCKIRLRGNDLLTGYVDDVAIQYTFDTLTVTARGRSKTADLVDCSALRKGGRWENATVKTIATDLCEPFGIDVTVDPLEDLDRPFKRFAIEPGEAAFQVIQRACRLRAAWATCAVDGSLHITRASAGHRSPVALEYGKNIISGGRFDSWSQRHSEYRIKGQVPSDDEISGAASSQMADAVFDRGVNRYRPLLVVSTGHDRKGDLRRRAQWERNRRAGAGERILYRVNGYGYDSADYVGQFKQHRRDAFRLWAPNMSAKVVDPRFEENDWLLISAVSYRWQAEGDDGGRTTDITLTRPEAFTLQEYPVRKRARVRSDLDGWWYSPHTDIGPLLERGKRIEPEPQETQTAPGGRIPFTYIPEK